MIEAHGITVRAGSATLVDDVSVAAHPGDLLAIIGPNGAGKSTLLRVLAGDIDPAEGDIVIDGRPASEVDIPTMAQILAMFSPDSGVAVPFSVWEVTMMGRHPRRRDPDNSARHNLRSLELCFAAVASADSGHPIAPGEAVEIMA